MSDLTRGLVLAVPGLQLREGLTGPLIDLAEYGGRV